MRTGNGSDDTLVIVSFAVSVLVRCRLFRILNPWKNVAILASGAEHCLFNRCAVRASGS